MAGQGVDKLGDGKAYEMLSCINGLAEWRRTSGDRRCLRAVVNAWDDITTKRNFITGEVSSPDYFRDDYLLPNASSGSENCDTITWLQLGVQLLRLTGEAAIPSSLNACCTTRFSAGSTRWQNVGGLVPMEGGKGYG